MTGVYRHGVAVAFTGPASVKANALANAGPKRVGHFSVGVVVYTPCGRHSHQGPAGRHRRG